MKTKHDIIMRHGEPDIHGSLTQTSREKMLQLGNQLSKRKLVRSDTDFLCSHMLRTLKTVHAIMKGSGCNIRKFEHQSQTLFSYEALCRVDEAIAYIRTFLESTETLVIVTHLEMARSLPHEFGKQFLGIDTIPKIDFGYGDGYVIDCTTKEFEFISFLKPLP